MAITLKKIWVNTQSEGRTELRLDFSNDRHHGLEIGAGDTPEQVFTKLEWLANNLRNDIKL